MKIQENEKRQVHRPRQRTKKAMEYKGDSDTDSKMWAQNSFQRLG